MDETTIRRLNELNRRFYERYADSFDATRASAWAGWIRLIPHLQAGMRVLDVGCGNGRFALFLAETLGRGAFSYHGFDSSPALLGRAERALRDVPGVTLEVRDLLTDPLPAASFDGVVLFGVLHHIAGAERRMTLLRSLAEHVAPGGILVFAAWRFYEYDRFRERIIPWVHVPGWEEAAVEAGDHLLDWQRDLSTPRYCHYVDDAEHEHLIVSTRLDVVEDFRADGFDGAANRYSVLLRKQT
ncbi:MAG: class I SAM-dependent methyltransferase [Anaerolineae bacterium]|nr:class I SAM-dependent methyltransferase [Anaerolineae bacterium]NUQ03528.1 class I SAM-dependent methyltransferase [Anaerolineae bacterium]